MPRVDNMQAKGVCAYVWGKQDAEELHGLKLGKDIIPVKRIMRPCAGRSHVKGTSSRASSLMLSPWWVGVENERV
jgi:hypothetical protein